MVKSTPGLNDVDPMVCQDVEAAAVIVMPFPPGHPVGYCGAVWTSPILCTTE